MLSRTFSTFWHIIRVYLTTFPRWVSPFNMYIPKYLRASSSCSQQEIARLVGTRHHRAPWVGCVECEGVVYYVQVWGRSTTVCLKGGTGGRMRRMRGCTGESGGGGATRPCPPKVQEGGIMSVGPQKAPKNIIFLSSSFFFSKVKLGPTKKK